MAEMMIATMWTKYVAEKKVMASTAITMANIFMWYFVLSVIIKDINNTGIIFLYALGCGMGTMVSLLLPDLKKNFQKVMRKNKKKVANRNTPITRAPQIYAIHK